jgi:hypothetical protein
MLPASTEQLSVGVPPPGRQNGQLTPAICVQAVPVAQLLLPLPQTERHTP